MGASLITPNLHKKPPSIRYYRGGTAEDGVSLEEWQLQVTDLAGKELNLSYADILELPQIEESRRYVCVCCWTIRRTWKGTLLKNVLDLAGIKISKGMYLTQTSIGSKDKGSYESTIDLFDAVERRAMLI